VRRVYFSFFMFDTNARVHDPSARQEMLRHMRELAAMGYAGFELHIAREAQTQQAFADYAAEVRAYADFRRELDEAGLAQVELTTNVGATADCDPSSPDPAVRAQALEFLKSRVDITAALRGSVMMGPVVVPYGSFISDVWSDALQDALDLRYRAAAAVLDALGQHALDCQVKVAIEPITHWETPGPNTLQQLLAFLENVPSTSIGVVIDSAHEALDGAGPEVFAEQVQALRQASRLHYVQASAPDRGDLARSWMPWEGFLRPVLAAYEGPIAIEVFNAVPAFAAGLRLSRRKFWIPGRDAPNGWPSAYDIARTALAKLRAECGNFEPARAQPAGSAF
jgi:sugar phosphate isomerase/epimerase